MATDPTQRLTEDPSTLQISDHALVTTSTQIQDFKEIA